MPALGPELVTFFKQSVAKRQTKFAPVASCWDALVPETLREHARGPCLRVRAAANAKLVTQSGILQHLDDRGGEFRGLRGDQRCQAASLRSASRRIAPQNKA